MLAHTYFTTLPNGNVWFGRVTAKGELKRAYAEWTEADFAKANSNLNKQRETIDAYGAHLRYTEELAKRLEMPSSNFYGHFVFQTPMPLAASVDGKTDAT